MVRVYRKWFSPHLHRDMELLVLGHSGARVIVFPTRQGRFFDYENFGMAEGIRERIESGHIQLFCVDSLDSESFYGFGQPPSHRIERHNAFERYILGEVLPFSRSENPHDVLVAHGCSIGAFHAVNVAFRHPHLFRRVVALSGRYDLTRPMACFPDLFEGYYDNEIYFHTPNHFVPNLSDPALLQHLRALDIRIAIGQDDYFFDSNRQLSDDLWQKGVWHTFDIWPGKAHKPEYWREMVARYF